MLKDLRANPTLAHVLPLAVFTGMLSVPGWFKIGFLMVIAILAFVNASSVPVAGCKDIDWKS